MVAEPVPRLAPRIAGTPREPSLIVLNGPSSVGKSTLARTLARTLGHGWDARHVDKAFPDLIRHPKRPIALWRTLLRHYRVSPAAFRTWGNACLLLAATSEDLARGRRLILDMVLLDELIAAHMCRVVPRDSTLLVGLHAPIEELERRESARRTRRAGMARAQTSTAHEYLEYDLAVDTSNASPELLAQSIKAHAKHHRAVGVVTTARTLGVDEESRRPN